MIGVLRHFVDVAVALAAVVHAFLVAFVAFRAGKNAFVLRVGIDLVLAVGLLDHGFVVAVARHADVVVARLLELHVLVVAAFAFEAVLLLNLLSPTTFGVVAFK